MDVSADALSPRLHYIGPLTSGTAFDGMVGVYVADYMDEGTVTTATLSNADGSVVYAVTHRHLASPAVLPTATVTVKIFGLAATVRLSFVKLSINRRALDHDCVAVPTRR